MITERNGLTSMHWSGLISDLVYSSILLQHKQQGDEKNKKKKKEKKDEDKDKDEEWNSDINVKRAGN